MSTFIAVLAGTTGAFIVAPLLIRLADKIANW